MKKISLLSLREKMEELDHLSNEESSQLIGGYSLSYTGNYNDNSCRTSVDCSPGGSGGGEIGIGRTF